MLEIGQIIDGKYKILNKIGQGGMSVVYLAMNERANKQWAIKEVRKDGVSNFEVVKQGLIAETDLLKKLSHPNLPSIIDVIDGEGTFLIVMDYIEGNSLSKALKQYGAQPQEDVIEWAKQLCDVLGYLHSRKPPIIYRDMKPSNVMLKPDGTVTLIDFGTAREFKSHSVADTTCLGTQGYAAPEQFGGKGQTDARTDIYCLGATLYHLVTGHNPCDPPYEMYPIRQWNPNLSSGLEEIIIKCTQKNPLDRYQSCAELMYALEHYEELDVGYRKSQKRKWAAFLTTSVLATVSVAGTVGFKVAESVVTKNSYNYFVEEASRKQVENWQEAVSYYKQAIKISPEKEAAYTGLLGLVAADNSFTSEENEILINEIDLNNKLAKLKNADKGAYGRISYELAKEYFFYYGDTADNSITTAGISKSIEWYSEAANFYEEPQGNQNITLSTQNVRNRAATLKTLAELCVKANNNSLGKDDLTGEGNNAVSYSEYFNKLYEIIQDDKETNGTIVIRTCKYMVNGLINARIQQLKSGGVTSDNLFTALSLVSDKVNQSTVIDETEKTILLGDIDKARKQISDLYGIEDTSVTEG